MLVGVRLQYDRTRPGTSIHIRITPQPKEKFQSILAGALGHQHPIRAQQAGAMQPLNRAGGKGPCPHGKTNLLEVEEVRAAGTMAQTAVTRGATV